MISKKILVKGLFVLFSLLVLPSSLQAVCVESPTHACWELPPDGPFYKEFSSMSKDELLGLSISVETGNKYILRPGSANVTGHLTTYWGKTDNGSSFWTIWDPSDVDADRYATNFSGQYRPKGVGDGVGEVVWLDWEGTGEYDIIEVELIDAQAFSPNMSGGISDDPSVSVDNSFIRKGAFTDGTSVLVIRVQPVDEIDQAIELEIKHTNKDSVFPQTSDFIGSLHKDFPVLPASDPGGNTGNTMLTLIEGDQKIAFYRPPNNFLFGKNAFKQKIQLSVKIDEQVICTEWINLIRPTVVLAHGFTLNPRNMRFMFFQLKKGGRKARVRLFDWSDTNTAGYNDVAFRIQQIIADEVNFQQNRKIAATRLDYFGHSMGGLIAKWYASNIPTTNKPRRNGFSNLFWPGQQFRRSENFGVGDIRRLVTVGSPFRGSPLADKLSNLLKFDGLKLIMPLFGWTGNLCAFDDQGETSIATFILSGQKPFVSWFPIIGLAAPDKTEIDEIGIMKSVAGELLGISPGDVGLRSENSDIVVNVISQIDAIGLFPPPGISHAVINDIVHSEEPESLEVSDQLVRALDLFFKKPTDSGFFAGYTIFNSSF